MGNETSVENRESQLEKKEKESRQDAKDDAVVRRSQRNGNIQNGKGMQKYPHYGQRGVTNQTFEEVVAREDNRNPSIPIGWMKYKTDMLQTDLYSVYYFAGWRVIMPKYISDVERRFLLRRLYQYGVSSIGYVTVGDTLVPQKLLVSNRQVLTAL